MKKLNAKQKAEIKHLKNIIFNIKKWLKNNTNEHNLSNDLQIDSENLLSYIAKWELEK